MSYDYSKQFLEYHKDLVASLRQAAEQGKTMEYRNADPSAIRNSRYLINNLLASLAFNYPGEAEIRQVLRCWTIYDRHKEEWVLNVGPAQKNLTGRPPTGYRGQQVTVLQPQNPGVYMHSAPIIDQTEIIRFVSKIESAKDMHTFQAELPGATTDQAVNTFENILEPLGLKLDITFDEPAQTLTVRRK